MRRDVLTHAVWLVSRATLLMEPAAGRPLPQAAMASSITVMVQL